MIDENSTSDPGDISGSEESFLEYPDKSKTLAMRKVISREVVL